MDVSRSGPPRGSAVPPPGPPREPPAGRRRPPRRVGDAPTSFNDLSREAGKEVRVLTRADITVPPGHPLDPSGRTVLSASDVSRALRRIAHEILEHNKGADDLVLLGIPSRGVELARRLADLVREVEGTEVPTGSLDITMHRDDLRHQPTRAPMHTVIPPGGIDDKVVVLVDDVLYSGRTIRAALDALSDLGR